MSPEVREALIRLRGWIEHWQEDRECGLCPTERSLVLAKEIADAALRSEGAK